MLRFQPPTFEQRSVFTRLGKVVYYTSVEPLWDSVSDQGQDAEGRVGKGQSTAFAATDLPTPLSAVAVSEITASAKQKPVVVFFHNFGGGASAYEWSKVYAALRSNYRVVAPDLIGWGGSAHPVRRYSTADYLQNIEDVIRCLCVKPVIAVASSFTASLVIRLAVAQPELFERLFVTCPAGFRDFGVVAGRRIPAPIINAPLVDQAIYALGAMNELAVRNFLENFLFARRDRLSAETVAAYLASAQQPHAEYAALSFLRGDLYFDLAPYLEQLQVPTAIAWGEKAQFTPVSLGERFAQLNPNAVQRFQVISETGLLPHLEQPGTVTALLLDWLAGLAG
ncbi:MAG: alpha/beta hydrolase [Phormidesmis sp. RL_2_1]|nr:alpha/beta hydrolase [Phormidesmis sp. RL_2_1]